MSSLFQLLTISALGYAAFMFYGKKPKEPLIVLSENGGLPTMAEADKIIQNSPPGSTGSPQFPILPGQYGMLGQYGVFG